MALITSQQLANYYELYTNIEVTFTKEVIKVTGLRSKQTSLRCIGYQWPCIVYSSSMAGAKVLASINSDLNQKLREANNLVSLRYSFNHPDNPDPITFFVSAKATGFNPYNDEHPELNFVTLKYTQRPSDDLISVLGALLDANVNAKRRKEERIDITAESVRKLGLKSKEGLLYIDEVPRKCILKDLSFSGAQVMMTGVAKFLLNKNAVLHLDLDDGKSSLSVPSKVVRFDNLPDQKGIGTVGLHFNENDISIEYKMRLNEYLSSSRKHN